MTLKKLSQMLRPAEWPLLGFALYVLLRALGTSHLAFKGLAPPEFLIIPFLTVFTFQLALAYRATPWQPELEERRKLHTVMLVPFLLVGLVSFLSFQTATSGEGKYAPILHWMAILLAALVAFVAPLFAWLVYGVHVKRHGRFRLSFFRETGALLASDLRDWMPPLALIFAYGAMGSFLSVPFFPDRDEELWSIDTWLFFGHSPHRMLESIIRPWLSEWLAAVYVSYTFMFPLVLGAVYACRAKAFRELAFASTFALATGYIVYTLVPAQGPLYIRQFTTSLDLYYLANIKDQLMDRGRVPRDCFPSLHTCMSLVMLFYAWKNIRWLGYLMAPIVISIPFACVYLRYHYVIDILAGIVLFVGTIALQRWIFARWQPPPTMPPITPAA